ncbi:DUF2256 domain-containing protein [Vreelandella titanicae]|uniref:DUF2256 domain-containing protein n=1 Tax=Vreelandella titanicae TaxID=664683 RepID=UPI001F2E2903|nr:DUF2256 domain-containing protein [Halomonas titanicae]MCE7518304.1 DUF2256 domain-containing protein [Halomonas titanicae]
MRRKQHLPQKDCAQCQRPFPWRKKWACCWNEVRYCSSGAVVVPSSQASHGDSTKFWAGMYP